MTTLYDVLVRYKGTTTVSINDGASDWYPDTLIDFLTESDAGIEELKSVAGIVNNEIRGPRGNYDLVFGRWNDHGEFVRG